MDRHEQPMTASTPIRVVAVDDHVILRSGIRLLLLTLDDIELVGEAHDGEEALRLCDALRPDVVLMDMVMPGMDGAATTRAIKQRHPQVQVVILSSFADSDLVSKATQAGAAAYLLKGATRQELAEAIRSAHAGVQLLGISAPATTGQTVRPAQPEPSGDLSERQREVLALVAQGLSNKEIAVRLVLSPYTVRFHISEILEKIGASTRAEAAAIAIQRHLLD